MWTITLTGKQLCVLLLVLPLYHTEDTKKDGTKLHSNIVWSQGKTRRLFARQKNSILRESHIAKHKSELVTPTRRCSRMTETCSSHVPCCDPCASCHCRLFNTVCHCWKMKPSCFKRV